MKFRLSLFPAAGVCLMSLHSFDVPAQGEDFTLSSSGFSDFDEYWAAARLLLSGSNPYSPGELLRVGQAVGRSGSVADIGFHFRSAWPITDGKTSFECRRWNLIKTPFASATCPQSSSS